MKDTCAVQTRGSKGGFSLLEMVVVIAIIFILAALSVPKLMTQVYSLRVRYSATNLSGTLQRARMEAVRKNAFYSVQYVAGSPAMEQVVDRNATAVGSIPPAVLGNSVGVVYGSGSGAPGETAFIASALPSPLTAAASSSGLPSFNARGLPCVATSTTVCTQTLGQGFVFFLSGMTASGGSVGWSAVTVTPSGRCEVWAYDGANWIQQ
jgi:prepilin-type N-terminal cleavage/methylation domain-containing protein